MDELVIFLVLTSEKESYQTGTMNNFNPFPESSWHLTLVHLSTTLLSSISAITTSWVSLSRVYSGHSYSNGPTLIIKESQDHKGISIRLVLFFFDCYCCWFRSTEESRTEISILFGPLASQTAESQPQKSLVSTFGKKKLKSKWDRKR